LEVVRLVAIDDRAKKIIDESNYEYFDDLIRGVGAFKVLKPLSYKFTRAFKLGSVDVMVGRWLRLRYDFQTYGSPMEGDSALHELFVKYGDRLIPFLRKPIREDFVKLVRLARRLIPARIEIDEYLLPDEVGDEEFEIIKSVIEVAEKVRRHNKKIIEEMEDVIAPYVIARTLNGHTGR